MRIEVMANSNTFHILKAEGCPAEFKAGNGWRVIYELRHLSIVMFEETQVINLAGSNPRVDKKENIVPALTALHEMVYQPTFSDDGSIVTLEHGKFRIEEWAGGQIVFQVLEMDEEFRSEVNCTYNKHEMPTFVIYSSRSPDLNSSDIYLRGDMRKRDFEVGRCADVSRTAIISALRDWSDNWPGWTSHRPTLAECCKYGSVETGGLFVFDSEVK